VCFVITGIKNCFVVAASYPFLVGIRGSVTHFSELEVTIHFQNELKETLQPCCVHVVTAESAAVNEHE